MEKKILYLVGAMTGEYSDRADWNVKVFSSKEKAAEFMKRLDEEVKKAIPLYKKYKDKFWLGPTEEGNENRIKFFEENPFPELENFVPEDLKSYIVSFDDEGINFYIEEIEFEE